MSVMTGQELRALRLSLKLKQAAVAAQIGTKKPAICSIEKGKAPLTNSMHLRYLAALRALTPGTGAVLCAHCRDAIEALGQAEAA